MAENGQKAAVYIQDVLPFVGAQRNLVVNRDGTYSLVIALSGLNLQLMSIGERQGMHRRLAIIFNLLEGYKFQLMAVVRTRDVKPLVDQLAEARRDETVPHLIEQSYQEEDYLNELAREGGIISRGYFLVVRLSKASPDEQDQQEESLWDEFMISFGFKKRGQARLTQTTVSVPLAVRDRANLLTETLVEQLRSLGFAAHAATEREIEELIRYILNGTGEGSDFMDRCVPTEMETKENYLRLGDTYAAGLYATTFPIRVKMGWLESLIKQPEQMIVSVHVDLLPSHQVERKLSGKASLLEALDMAAQQRQNVEQRRLDIQRESAEVMMRALADETENIGFLSVRVLAQAPSVDLLTRRMRRLDQKLRELRLSPANALLHQDRFLISCLPLAMDTIASDFNRRNATTSGLVCAVPNVVMDLGHRGGVVLGINKQDRSLVVLDRFKLTSYHKITIAETGGGKTMAEFIETIRGLLRGWRYVWFDPQNTGMPQMMRLTGGEIIDLGPDGGVILNPMDMGAVGGVQGSLTERVLFLTALIQLMAERNLDAAEKSKLARAIRHCYEINHKPILKDLTTILPSEGLGRLAEELERFVAPDVYGSLFNGHTNVMLNSHCISFNLRDLDEAQLRPIRVFQALDYTWSWIRKSRWPPKVMVVDEIGLLLRFNDIAQYVRDLYKRGRAFGLSVVAIDQNPANFIDNQFGRQMIENAAIIQLMKQNELGVEKLRQHFKLTQGEVDSLLGAEPGDALLIVEGKRLHMRFSMSERQLQGLSTRPEDVVKRQG